ncbi:MAG: hypothetical protein IT583_03550 [Verrucomicrobia bacterium]|nr:hypothetical protein [Verrucomicrobiota bacterium]
MKNRIKQNKLGSIFLAALCLPVASSLASTITSASATGSSSGFGTVSYNVGTNVSEFILFGKTSAAAEYITSTGALHIAKAVNGDGTTGYNNTYDATKYSWTGGTPTLSGTHNIEAAQWIGSASADPYTWASILITNPAEAFQFSFFAHDYYAAVDLQVLLNGSLLGSYTNVMSSSYLPGGSGEARNTDYFYDFSFTGMTAGDTLEFKFVNLQNLGSDWANIAFLSASLNYDAPENITSNLKSMPSAVPEPASALMIALGGVLITGYRRFFGKM